MMAGEISFSLKEQDSVAASRTNYLRGLASWRFFRKILILAACVGVGGAVLLIVTGEDIFDAFVTGGIAAAAGLAGLIICAVISFLLLPSRARRLFRQQRSIHQSMEVKWSEHGAIWNTARGTHNMLWSDYHKWASTPKGFLVYLNDNLYHFIPKRVLSDTECADLQKTLEASGLKKR